MIALLMGIALAQDPFAGWEGSRWLVELEETLPLQLAIAGPDQAPPVVRAFQVQAVVSCPELELAGKKAAFAKCTFEDLSLRAAPQSDPGDRLGEYTTALRGFTQALEKGKIELKIKADGRLAQIDVEAPSKTDPLTVEAIRGLSVDLFAGFSLYREDVPEGSPWHEKNSLMMRAPTQALGNGLTKIKHQPTDYEGKKLVQSEGSGTYTSPYISWGAGDLNRMGSVSSMAGESGSLAGGSAAAGERTFDAILTSVVVMGEHPHVFSERIWSVNSNPKPDLTGLTGTPLWCSGHIRKLRDGQESKLGTSGLVSAPGAKFGDLPAWEPLNPVGG